MESIYALIAKYYPLNTPAQAVYMAHANAVKVMAVQIVTAHPELGADRQFVAEAALLHDIGICFTHAPQIECNGTYPYVAHGYLGSELLQQEGYPRHALVAERHTGCGISLQQIEEANLPLPHREMIPLTIEEQIVCFADKFFSKTKLNQQKTVAEARKSILKFGEAGVVRFDHWSELFL